MLPSGLPETIKDDEDLARFLVQSNQYTATSVKPSVFLPNPADRETSVSRHGREPVERLRKLGLVATEGRKLIGAAVLNAASVRAADLELSSDEPPERHAVIRNWPWDESDPILQKAKQKEIALTLASASGRPVIF